MEEHGQVELIDYLRVLWRRRWLILGGVLLSVLVAGVTSLLLPKEYETSLQLRIGQVWGKQVDDTYRIAAIINSEPFFDKVREKTNLAKTANEIKKSEDIVASVAESGKQPHPGVYPVLVNIVTKARTAKKAVEIAESVAGLVIQEHQARFAELLREYKNYEKALEDKVQSIQKGIEDLNATLEHQRSNPKVNSEAIILGQTDAEKQQSQLVAFVRELRDARINNAAKVVTQNTTIVLSPVMPEKHVHPKITLNVLLAGIISLILFLIVAFFLEYLERVTRRERNHRL